MFYCICFQIIGRDGEGEREWETYSGSEPDEYFQEEVSAINDQSK